MPAIDERTTRRVLAPRNRTAAKPSSFQQHESVVQRIMTTSRNTQARPAPSVVTIDRSSTEAEQQSADVQLAGKARSSRARLERALAVCSSDDAPTGSGAAWTNSERTSSYARQPDSGAGHRAPARSTSRHHHAVGGMSRHSSSSGEGKLATDQARGRPRHELGAISSDPLRTPSITSTARQRDRTARNGQSSVQTATKREQRAKSQKCQNATSTGALLPRIRIACALTNGTDDEQQNTLGRAPSHGFHQALTSQPMALLNDPAAASLNGESTTLARGANAGEDGGRHDEAPLLGPASRLNLCAIREGVASVASSYGADIESALSGHESPCATATQTQVKPAATKSSSTGENLTFPKLGRSPKTTPGGPRMTSIVAARRNMRPLRNRTRDRTRTQPTSGLSTVAGEHAASDRSVLLSKTFPGGFVSLPVGVGWAGDGPGPGVQRPGRNAADIPMQGTSTGLRLSGHGMPSGESWSTYRNFTTAAAAAPAQTVSPGARQVSSPHRAKAWAGIPHPQSSLVPSCETDPARRVRRQFSQPSPVATTRRHHHSQVKLSPLGKTVAMVAAGQTAHRRSGGSGSTASPANAAAKTAHQPVVIYSTTVQSRHVVADSADILARASSRRASSSTDVVVQRTPGKKPSSASHNAAASELSRDQCWAATAAGASPTAAGHVKSPLPLTPECTASAALDYSKPAEPSSSTNGRTKRLVVFKGVMGKSPFSKHHHHSRGNHHHHHRRSHGDTSRVRMLELVDIDPGFAASDEGDPIGNQGDEMPSPPRPHAVHRTADDDNSDGELAPGTPRALVLREGASVRRRLFRQLSTSSMPASSGAELEVRTGDRSSSSMSSSDGGDGGGERGHHQRHHRRVPSRPGGVQQPGSKLCRRRKAERSVQVTTAATADCTAGKRHRAITAHTLDSDGVSPAGSVTSWSAGDRLSDWPRSDDDSDRLSARVR
ncbi:uncharacterized protein LOC135821082 [Sycon ciliatum]|uniref:uncharacterized protein LOC135821082 n=1 Tax=Sycon ciliatum TaxID=27933 RepID=UPI0031F6C63A